MPSSLPLCEAYQYNAFSKNKTTKPVAFAIYRRCCQSVGCEWFVCAECGSREAGVFNPYRPAESQVIDADELSLAFDDSVDFDMSVDTDELQTGFWDGSATDALAVDDPSATIDSSELLSGAFMSPTTGRFVKIGQRWGFIPTNPRSVTVVRANKADDQKPENKFRTVSAIEKLRSSSFTAVELVPSNPLRERGQTAERFSLSSLSQKSPKLTDSVVVKKLIVSDNLVLRRAMGEIESQDVDSQWIVSGEISRFNNESHLKIRTAKLSD